MSNIQYQSLLQSIATRIADYRQGEIPTITPDHVDRWIRQFARFGFHGKTQIIILEEMDRILKSCYISRRQAKAFITKVLTSDKLFGSNFLKTIRNVRFLRIQTRGSSQNDLLDLCEPILQHVHGVSLEDCGSSPKAYIYLDDCLYSGNRVRRDIKSWLPNAARRTNLHLIFFATHTEGLNYSKRVIEEAAQQKNISVKFWRLHKFSNSRWNPTRFDCFWPRENLSKTGGGDLINRYVQEVNERRQNSEKSLPPLFRPNNMPTQNNIFSSSKARDIIEFAFLKAGAYIVSLPKSPNQSMRPLGYDYLESLGFGAILVTYRNIANNCPIALWWGDPDKSYPLNAWYPLFPRKVNITSNFEEELF